MSSSLPRRDFLKQLAAASAVSLAPGLIVRRLTAADVPEMKPGEAGTLYCVGYAHLDTQWRWSYPIVIREFLHNTLVDNFALFEQYPNYVFNFTGANRYRLMKEYFPVDYAKMQEYVKKGRWFPAGSSWEEGIVDEPSSESVVRHVLYGNQYFRRELGTASSEYMLPDSFGFPASLPTLLAHCGLKGFSTQKLSWNSANGIPFNLGSWIGPDGRSVVAALNCLSYGAKLKGDQTRDETWLKRLKDDQARCGVALDYRYYGTGDRGGAPDAGSAAAMEESLKGTGPIKIVSARGSDLFDQITPEQVAKLPTYQGDLLLTEHSAGTPSSQAFMKKLNRKNEFRADEAERAAVTALLFAGTSYPRAQLTEGWQMVLAGQFHDILAGTCKPDSYAFAWNDGYLARNRLTQVRDASVSALARGLDTTAGEIPLVVYNPISSTRTDVVEATIAFASEAPASVSVTGPDGKPVPAQVNRREGNRATIAFAATVGPVSASTFGVSAAHEAVKSTLSVSSMGLSNHRYDVKLNAAGDIASIRDLAAGRELLREPARLAFLREDPARYMAWNMEYDDATRPPFAYVDGPAVITVVEEGPARVAVKVERQAQGSTVAQTIRLSAGEAGNRLEFDTWVDWHTPDAALKAVFPLTVANKVATYNWEAGTVERATDNPNLFEWPSHQWFDLTDSSGAYGVSVLEDCKYGSDKPDDSTLRLTLMFTPGTKRSADYHDQLSQDFGRHQFTYALLGHEGDWRKGNSPWEAARLNQPLTAFRAEKSAGALGQSVSLLTTSSERVMVKALKRAEESDEIIVRLQELSGQGSGPFTVGGPIPILSAREVDGQERPIGSATVVSGKLSASLGGYGLRAFALTFAPRTNASAGPKSASVPLPYNLQVTTKDGEHTPDKSGMDRTGRSYPSEQFPQHLVLDEVRFEFAPSDAPNALRCNGEAIALPAGNWERLHFIAASAGGRDAVSFGVDGVETQVEIQNWDGLIGQPDYRLWNTTDFPEITYDWDGAFVGVAPGYLCTDPVAWMASHRHSETGVNEIYDYSYMFRYSIPLQPGAKQLVLPVSLRVRILAMTVTSGDIPALPVSADLTVV